MRWTCAGYEMEMSVCGKTYMCIFRQQNQIAVLASSVLYIIRVVFKTKKKPNSKLTKVQHTHSTGYTVRYRKTIGDLVGARHT